jgi:hypothetical protein
VQPVVGVVWAGVLHSTNLCTPWIYRPGNSLYHPPARTISKEDRLVPKGRKKRSRAEQKIKDLRERNTRMSSGGESMALLERDINKRLGSLVETGQKMIAKARKKKRK